MILGLRFLSYKFRLVTGAYIGLILILIGIFNSNQYQANGKRLSISDQKQSYFLLITEQPTETAKSIKVIGKVFSNDQNKNPNSTKTILYFAKDSLSHKLKYGDFLSIDVRLNEIKAPQNPHEFNYRKYLRNKNIHYQAYLPAGSWKIIDHNQANPIKQFAINSRQYLLKSLKNAKLSDSEFAVAAAILLGQDDILDAETRQDYAGAGAMHVLCVSGLHVGIIYLAFNFILGFLKRRKFQKLLKTILLILIIWIYALITGFSPSVLRASVMLSFIVLGNALNKKGSVYNSIAASAFVLLLLSPSMIMEVGFQLSYAAVIGIVSIYSLLKKHLKHNNRIIDKILSILIVSAAAQIGTFPLAIFYFHQFPIYFLLTNLVVILLATIIINLGFIFLILSSVPIISSGLQFIFSLLLNGMNVYVSWIESLPGSTLKSLVLNPTEIFIIYLLIIGLAQSLLKKSKNWFVLSISLILILSIGFVYENHSQLKQKNLIIYTIRGHSIYEFQRGKSSSVFMDSTLLNNEQKINFHLSSNWIYSGIKNPELVAISNKKYQNDKFGLLKQKNLFFFGKKTFLRIDRENYNYIKKLHATVDYLIISENVKISLLDLFKYFNPELIILDSSNTFYYEQKIITEANKNQIPIYSVQRSGALTIPF